MLVTWFCPGMPASGLRAPKLDYIPVPSLCRGSEKGGRVRLWLGKGSSIQEASAHPATPPVATTCPLVGTQPRPLAQKPEVGDHRALCPPLLLMPPSAGLPTSPRQQGACLLLPPQDPPQLGWEGWGPGLPPAHRAWLGRKAKRGWRACSSSGHPLHVDSIPGY